MDDRGDLGLVMELLSSLKTKARMTGVEVVELMRVAEEWWPDEEERALALHQATRWDDGKPVETKPAVKHPFPFLSARLREVAGHRAARAA